MGMSIVLTVLTAVWGLVETNTEVFYQLAKMNGKCQQM